MYLDQWVWIRLARAANGEPREDSDLQVLTAVQDAAENGVAFPLSTTHHIETSQITNPRSRLDVARTMASISHCRTLRARKVLLRHQMLHAMHVAFSRPAFRLRPRKYSAQVFAGRSTGSPAHGSCAVRTARWTRPRLTGMPEFLRKANQLAELMILAGPGDEEVPGCLPQRLRYAANTAQSRDTSRPCWQAGPTPGSGIRGFRFISRVQPGVPLPPPGKLPRGRVNPAPLTSARPRCTRPRSVTAAPSPRLPAWSRTAGTAMAAGWPTLLTGGAPGSAVPRHVAAAGCSTWTP